MALRFFKFFQNTIRKYQSAFINNRISFQEQLIRRIQIQSQVTRLSEYYQIDINNQEYNSSFNTFTKLFKSKIQHKFYEVTTQTLKRMPTSKLFIEQQQQQQFPQITYPKLNKQYPREIISFYKLRTYSYNFHKDIQDRHYSIENPLCICGEFDQFEHILKCDCYIDMRECITAKIGKCDIKRLITYDQNYINQFPRNKLEYINLQIKIFHRMLLKRRLELFELEKEELQENSESKREEEKDQEQNEENEEYKEEQEEQNEDQKEQTDDEDDIVEEEDEDKDESVKK